MYSLDVKVSVIYTAGAESPCSFKRDKRIWVYGFLRLNNGLYTNKQNTSENCPRYKRFI